MMKKHTLILQEKRSTSLSCKEDFKNIISKKTQQVKKGLAPPTQEKNLY